MKNKAILSLMAAVMLSLSFGGAASAEEAAVIEETAVVEEIAEVDVTAEEVVEFTDEAEEEIVYATAGWQKSTKGWWYSFSDGTYARGGFYQIDGKYYYFNASGYMMKGWIQTGTESNPTWYYMTTDGSMCSAGWHKINGKWYYFSTTSSGYVYMNKNTALGGRMQISGVIYYFDKGGALHLGWVQDSQGRWRYYTEFGETAGWKRIDGKWYYFDPDTKFMQTGGEKTIDGNLYFFNTKGSLYIGWGQASEENWIYYTENGLASGWKQIDGKWYYFDPETSYMVTGEKMIKDHLYLFSEKGVMYTGWYQTYNETWMYYGEDGVAVTGWKKINNKWYYFDQESYEMFAPGFEYIDDQIYHFNEKGSLDIGWFYFKSDLLEGWCYANLDGTLAEGWKKINNKYYYFDEVTYTMIVGGHQWIDDELYFFTNSGVMRTGWIEEEFEWYFCDPNGAAHRGWLQRGGKWYYFDPQSCFMYADLMVEDTYSGFIWTLDAENRDAYFDENGVFQYYVD